MGKISRSEWVNTQANPDQKCPLPWVVREFRRIGVINVTIIFFYFFIFFMWVGAGGGGRLLRYNYPGMRLKHGLKNFSHHLEKVMKTLVPFILLRVAVLF